MFFADLIQPASPDATASPTSLLDSFFSPKKSEREILNYVPSKSFLQTSFSELSNECDKKGKNIFKRASRPLVCIKAFGKYILFFDNFITKKYFLRHLHKKMGNFETSSPCVYVSEFFEGILTPSPLDCGHTVRASL